MKMGGGCLKVVEKHQVPVVRKEDSAIHRINHYPLDSAIGFPNTYSLDSVYPFNSAIQSLNNRGLIVHHHNKVPLIPLAN